MEPPKQPYVDPSEDDSWTEGVRAWRASRPPVERPPTDLSKRKPQKPERMMGGIQSVVLVLGIVLGAFLLIGIVLLNFNAGGRALTFAPDQLPVTKVGDAYSVRIGVGGSASPLQSVALTRGGLPPGLSLVLTRTESNAVNDIHISGSPTTAGSYEFTLGALTSGRSVSGFSIAGQSGYRDYVIVVNQ